MGCLLASFIDPGKSLRGVTSIVERALKGVRIIRVELAHVEVRRQHEDLRKCLRTKTVPQSSNS